MPAAFPVASLVALICEDHVANLRWGLRLEFFQSKATETKARSLKRSERSP